MELLDQFLKHGDQWPKRDPLKRAMLQRDLLAVFDWLVALDAPGEELHRLRLAKKIAVCIQQLGMTGEEIAALLDNYSQAVKSGRFASAYDPDDPTQPFLPGDLFQNDSSWLPLGTYRGDLCAIRHAEEFCGRSVFLVFVSHAKGREVIKSFIETLGGQFPSESGSVPPGTQLALVRQAILLDNNGEPIQTKLTESIQLRVYHPVHHTTRGLSVRQSVFEFRLSRKSLFEKEDGGLIALSRSQREFSQFLTHGLDPFETSPNQLPSENFRVTVLSSCTSCHENSGSVRSVLSYTRRFGPGDSPVRLAVFPTDRERDLAIAWRKRQPSHWLLKLTYHPALGVVSISLTVLIVVSFCFAVFVICRFLRRRYRNRSSKIGCDSHAPAK